MLGLPKGKVFLAPWDADWEKEYLLEKAKIEGLMGNRLVSCHHIGSTAVRGLSAKPIIDIAIEIESFAVGFMCADALSALGYKHRIIEELPDRHYFSKGDPRTHQIHMFPQGSIYLKKQIAFRDCLIKDKKTRDEYQSIKEKLADQYGNDKLAYADAKTAYINDVLIGIGF